jgi:hypothetical protein
MSVRSRSLPDLPAFALVIGGQGRQGSLRASHRHPGHSHGSSTSLRLSPTLLTTLFPGTDGIRVMPLAIVAVVVTFVLTIRLAGQRVPQPARAERGPHGWGEPGPVGGGQPPAVPEGGEELAGRSPAACCRGRAPRACGEADSSIDGCLGGSGAVAGPSGCAVAPGRRAGGTPFPASVQLLHLAGGGIRRLAGSGRGARWATDTNLYAVDGCPPRSAGTGARFSAHEIDSTLTGHRPLGVGLRHPCASRRLSFGLIHSRPELFTGEREPPSCPGPVHSRPVADGPA